MQNGHPVAYFAKTLSDPQKNCTAMEQKLLSIEDTLQEFCSTLLGAKTRIQTDHKNVTFTTLKFNDYRVGVGGGSPILYYIEVKNNISADNISRLYSLSTSDQP